MVTGKQHGRNAGFILRAFSIFLILALIITMSPSTGLLAPTEVYAADEDNNLSFELRATSAMQDGTTTITYNLTKIVVASGSYKSIMVSFPSSLSIHVPNTATYNPVWNLTTDAGNTVSTYSYIVGSANDTQSATSDKIKEFLEQLSFSTTTPPDGSAGIKVSISRNSMASYVDEGENEHFYEVFSQSSNITWLDAYNAAKKKTYRGMEGYLATITSQEEQNMIYRTITSTTAWLGGTRMLKGTGSNVRQINGVTTDKTLPASTDITANFTIAPATANKWYWVDGPEQGQVFYDSATYVGTYGHYPSAPTTNPVYHGEYGFFNASPNGQTVLDDGTGTWGIPDGDNDKRLSPAGSATGNSSKTVYSSNAQEPNNSGNEFVLQFAYSSRPSWNDFPNSGGAVQTYIVEYGGYNPADIGNGKHPLPDVNEHEELPSVPVTVHYASRLNPDEPLTNLSTIQLTGNRVGDQFVAEPLDIRGYTFVGFDANNNNTDPVAVYHEGAYTWTDSDGMTHTKSNVVMGAISGWIQNITFLYQPKASTVTFHPNYKSEDPNYWEGLGTVAPQSKSVTYDSKYGSLATASREGYTLAGWSLDPDCTPADTEKLISEITTVEKYEDHTLYAVWAPKPGYGVHYDLNGGKLNVSGTDYSAIPNKTKVSWSDGGLLSGTPSGTADADYTDQTSPAWKNPTRDYYFFTGWYVSLNGSGSDVQNSDTYGDLASNDRNAFIELRAQWSRNETFAVKYQLNGGTIDGQGAITNKNDLSLDDTELIPSTDPVKPGYDFLGWKLTKRGTEPATDDPAVMVNAQMTYGQVAPEEPDDSTVTLEARWEPLSYTVNYDLDGGLVDGNTEIGSRSVLYTDRNLVQGLNPTRPDDPNGDGWVFSGWELSKVGSEDKDGSRAVTAADSYGELAENDTATSITLKAQWSPAIRYAVSYDLNGGNVEGEVTIPDKSVGYTDTKLLPVDSDSKLTNPVKTGYDFVGWRQLYKNGTLSADTIGQNHQYDWLSESATDRYVTLQAQWTAQTGFIVKYDSNNNNVGLDPADRTVSWETANLLPTQAQTNQITIPEGKYLAGWEICKIGNENITPHEVFNTANYGSLVKDQDDVSIVLRAIWADVSVWTVQYDSNGGSPANIDSKKLTADTQNVLPATNTPNRVGYDFVGWSVSENRKVSIASDYIVEDTDTFKDLVAESQYQPYYTIRLKAMWAPKTNFTVKYVPSQPVGDPVAGLDLKGNVAWTGQSLLPDVTPTWEHHTLVGWKLVAANTNGYSESLDNPYPTGDNAFITEGYSYSTLAEYIHSTGILGSEKADEITSLTLQPVWVEEARYNVNYDLDGGTYDGKSTYPSASVYWSDGVLPKDNILHNDIIPVKSGYTFDGWKVTANASAEGALLDKVLDEHTYGFLAVDPSVAFIRLKAQWEVIEYKVNYDLNFEDDEYGSDPVSYAPRTDVGYNQTNLYPVNPNKDPKRIGSGYSFAGWYTESEGGTRIESTTSYKSLVDNDSVGAITLYAHWMNSQATVTFDKNNSDAGSIDANPISKTINMDEPYGGIMEGSDYSNPLPTGNDAPKRTGYTFSGWYTQPTGGTRVYDDTIVTITGNHTLYARWTPKNNYKVEYDYRDVTGNEAIGKVESKSPLSWNGTGLLPSQPTRIGWTFAGWWTEPDGGGKEVTNSTQYSVLTVNGTADPDDSIMSVIIYANWTLKKDYKVNYDLNGADHVENNPVSEGAGIDALDISAWIQSGLMPVETVKRYGYIFNGWKHTYREDTLVTDGTVITDSNNDDVTYAQLAGDDEIEKIKLQAQWDVTTDNELLFNNNHALATATPSAITELTFNKTLAEQGKTLPLAETDAPKLKGYTFIGWDEQPNHFTEGVGTVTSEDGTTLVTPDFTTANNVNWSPSKTVYAVWKTTEDNTLNFNKNHEDATKGNVDSLTDLIYDKTIAEQNKSLPETGHGIPTLTGYEFVGWNTDENYFKVGVGSVTENDGNTLVDPNFNNSNKVNWEGEKTVYAVWKASDNNRLILNKNHDNATLGEVTSLSGLIYDKTISGQDKSLPSGAWEIPTLNGYTLIGWDTKANFFKAGVGTVTTNDGDTVVEPDFTNSDKVDWTGNKTVYAVWEAKTYTIHYLTGTANQSGVTNNGYWWSDADRQEGFDSITGWQDENLGSETGDKIYEIESVDKGATWITNNLIPPRWLYMDGIDDDNYHFAGWVLVDNDTLEPIPGADIVVPETKFSELAAHAGGDSITEITLMGTWTKSYAVFYDLQKGSYTGSGYPISADYYIDENEEVTFRSTPERTGYIFAGWQLVMRDAENVVNGSVYEADETELYKNLAAIPSSSDIAENVTLKDTWTATSNNKLVFDKNNNNAAAGEVASLSELIYDKTISGQDETLPNTSPDIPTLTGYEFVGWDTKANYFKIGVGSVTENDGTTLVEPDFTDSNTVNWVGTKTVYAVWKVSDSNRLVFNKNNDNATAGEITSVSGLIYDITITGQGKSLPETEPDIPTLTGHTFVGWDTKANFFKAGVGTVTTNDGNTRVTPDFADTANVNWVGLKTVYAVWKATANKIQFDGNGSTSGTMTDQSFNYGETLSLTTNNFSRNGYIFAGWAESSDGDVSYGNEANYTYSSDPYVDTITLYAIWTPKDNFTVRYDTNGGIPSSIADKTNVKWIDDELISTPAMTKNGYTFTGWKLSKRDSNIISQQEINEADIISDDDSYGSLAEQDGVSSITLQAQWTEKTGYKVSYDLNGGEPAATEKTDLKWTDNSMIPTGTYTKNGYTLIGWKLSKKDNNQISDGDIAVSDLVTNITTYGSLAADDTVKSMTLQAQWAPKEGYEVNYDLNGGSGDKPLENKLNIKWTDKDFIPMDTVFTKEGHTFGGWKLSKLGNNDVSGVIMADADTVKPSDTYASLAVEDTVRSITLKIQWIENSVTINYNSTKGGSVSRASETVRTSSDTPKGSVATADSEYSFVRWEDSNGNPVCIDNTLIPKKVNGINVEETYTAVFEKKNGISGGYKVLHYLVDGNQITLHETENFNGIVESTVTADPKTGYDGYTYASGYTGEVKKGVIPADKVLTLKLYYTRNAYEITYKIEGAIPPGHETSLNSKEAGYNSEMSIPDSPAEDGYIFIGWRSGDVMVSGDGTFVMPDHDVELVGVWVLGSGYWYEVEHYLVDAEGKTELYETERLLGLVNTEVEAIPKTGYKGYEYNPTHQGEIKSGQLEADDILKLKVYYTPSQHKITYGFTGLNPIGAILPPFREAHYGTEQNVESPLTLDHYVFSGWRTLDARVVDLTFTMPDRDVSFLGSWKDFDRLLTVKFVDHDDTLIKSEQVSYGKDATAPASPKRKGHKFTTWDRSYKNVTDHITVKAVYKKVNKKNQNSSYDPVSSKSDKSIKGQDHSTNDSKNLIAVIFLCMLAVLVFVTLYIRRLRKIKHN